MNITFYSAFDSVLNTLSGELLLIASNFTHLAVTHRQKVMLHPVQYIITDNGIAFAEELKAYSK